MLPVSSGCENDSGRSVGAVVVLGVGCAEVAQVWIKTERFASVSVFANP